MAETDNLLPAQQPPNSVHTRYPHLFSPLQIGPITAKNRIAHGPHATGFVKDALYTDQLVAYHRERARGGAAVIVSQAIQVIPDYGDLRDLDERIVPWFQKVAEAVHPYGARYLAELSAGGRQGKYHGSGAEIFHAPSPVPNQPRYGFGWRVPHEMESAQIREIISAFGPAAQRCREGGIDGIELHFAHGNLAHQFMSPLTNHRTDDWGGSVENRLRFAREVLYTVREAVGRDLAVGCRLTGSELEEGGLTRLDMMEIAGLLDELKLLDHISVTMGHYSDLLNCARNIPDMSFKPALWGSYGAAIKQIVQVPVFLVGRINHPAEAEDLLARGQCDMVVMVRALIADPYLPAKAFTGQVEDIRLCVGIQDGCWGHYELGRGITCVQNPVAGREGEWSGELPRAPRPRRVVVVGGGPAGLECARVAAERGHRVVLLERERILGGQVALAARAPHREELGQIVEWLQRRCEKAGVEMALGAEATPESILAMAPEVVVVATGAVPGTLGADVEDGARIVDAWSVLQGRAEVGKRVLVADETGQRTGFSVAEYLAARGHQVEFTTPLVYPGQNIEPTGWRMTYQRLLELGVKFRTLAAVVGVEGERVTLRNAYTGAMETVEGIETLVVSASPRAHDGLHRALKGQVEQLHLIGDGLSPRGIEEAIYEGQKVGREI